MGRVARLIVLVSGLILAFPIVVVAGTQGGCPIRDTTQLRLWENGSGDTSDGNDDLAVCGNIANLGSISHSLSGNCNRSPLPGSTTWSKCVSSWSVYLPSSEYVACIYALANYNGLFSWVVGPKSGTRWNFDGLQKNDQAVSVRILYQAGGAQSDDCNSV